MTTPKLHHYVPRFYLKRFLDIDGLLWVFDKVNQKVFQTTPESIAAETHFYRIPDLIGTEHDPNFLEAEFYALESTIAGLTERWLSSAANLNPIEKVEMTDEERQEMSLFISLQFLRTAEQRDILAAFAQDTAYKEEISKDELTKSIVLDRLAKSGRYSNVLEIMKGRETQSCDSRATCRSMLTLAASLAYLGETSRASTILKVIHDPAKSFGFARRWQQIEETANDTKR